MTVTPFSIYIWFPHQATVSKYGHNKLLTFGCGQKKKNKNKKRSLWNCTTVVDHSLLSPTAPEASSQLRAPSNSTDKATNQPLPGIMVRGPRQLLAMCILNKGLSILSCYEMALLDENRKGCIDWELHSLEVKKKSNPFWSHHICQNYASFEHSFLFPSSFPGLCWPLLLCKTK